jgi:hypothetical protein
MGWQTWLNSNAMAAQVILNLFGWKAIQQLMDLGFINACAAIALEQKI